MGLGPLNTMQVTILFACMMMVAMAAAAPAVPKGVSLSFGPQASWSAVNCSFDSIVQQPPSFICQVQQRSGVSFSVEPEEISLRYQYKKKVPLWSRRNPKFAASFSTSYTIEFRRFIDQVEAGTFTPFGEGWAFAITPDQNVGDSSFESLGLFEINESTGASLRGANTRTVAVEIDVSRSLGTWDATPPHLGLDINSVKSVVTRPLPRFRLLADRKIGVFIDYDAANRRLEVRLHILPVGSKAAPSKRHSRLFLSYSGLRLSDIVQESSYVGFSSRIPEHMWGAYILYDWKFSTKWVPVK